MGTGREDNKRKISYSESKNSEFNQQKSIETYDFKCDKHPAGRSRLLIGAILIARGKISWSGVQLPASNNLSFGSQLNTLEAV